MNIQNNFGGLLYSGKTGIRGNKYKYKAIFQLAITILLLSATIIMLIWVIIDCSEVIIELLGIVATIIGGSIFYAGIKVDYFRLHRPPIQIYAKGIAKTFLDENTQKFQYGFVYFKDIGKILFTDKNSRRNYEIICIIEKKEDTDFVYLPYADRYFTELSSFGIIMQSDFIYEPKKFKKLLLEKAKEFGVPIEYDHADDTKSEDKNEGNENGILKR